MRLEVFPNLMGNLHFSLKNWHFGTHVLDDVPSLKQVTITADGHFSDPAGLPCKHPDLLLHKLNRKSKHFPNINSSECGSVEHLSKLGFQEAIHRRGLMTEEPEVNETHALIAEYIRNHPDDSFQTIASRLGVALSTVSRIARTNGLSRHNSITINPNLLEEK
ncbi:hypothetical protein [Occallatibacter savannae]|uniref:hypothetical protein n=1 Tax=Occallatibacter savannae TaxID=1002691 RepID=UPI000D69998C|nr:hypothetical protein [Occallatibacter savannae]